MKPLSRRDCVIQPRVATESLPWVSGSNPYPTLRGLHQNPLRPPHSLPHPDHATAPTHSAARTGLRALPCIVFATCFCASTLRAQLTLLPPQTPHVAFAGTPQEIPLAWRNVGATTLTYDLRMRLLQATSSTAAPFDEVPWKPLQILPHQTVLESATLTFPLVRAETRFILQWLTESNQVLGTSQVLVYPPDLLKDLKPLSGDQPLGIFDPLHQLEPLLKTVGIEFCDLADDVDHFTGKLAILGPFKSKDQFGENLRSALKPLIRKGLAVVWIAPRTQTPDVLRPSFQTIPLGKGAVVVVQPDLLPNLAGNPVSQLNLIRLSRLAINPEPLRLATLLNDSSTD